ncbi:MAG: cation:proton antiporter [Ruminococcus sp.]|nr:cation:proton antiporter [Ruminococcus sp.]
MEDYEFLLSIAIILLSTKFLGLVSKKVKLPQVVGSLVAGLLIGPAFLNLVPSSEFLSNISELGVIVLMFSAGLEVDIKELKKCGLASFIIALIGVIVPLIGGYLTFAPFNESTADSTKIFYENLFMGLILTATSVSITVETLKELGKLSTRAGNAILGAALIDDILGIIALTLITSLAPSDDSSVEKTAVGIVLLKILLFFIVAFAACFIFHKLFNDWTTKTGKDMRRFIITSFVFCLALSYIAEVGFGVADITGAFFAGVAISGTTECRYVTNRFETLSYMLLSPVFFASIGLKVELSSMSGKIILFTVILSIVAILTKVVGCGLGALACKYNTKESIQIGVGMISRGEVALIIANKGADMGLIDTEKYFGPVVIMVVVTTIITPILLKLVFKDKDDTNHKDSGLVENINKHIQYEKDIQSM